jgi:hypothetical protein
MDLLPEHALGRAAIHGEFLKPRVFRLANTGGTNVAQRKILRSGIVDGSQSPSIMTLKVTIEK